MYNKQSNLLFTCTQSIPNKTIIIAFIGIMFGNLQAQNISYFPVDSSDTFYYLQYNRTLGSNQSSDTSYQTISKYKQLDDSTISRQIAVDSTGGHKTLNDTCKERLSSFVCKNDIIHISSDSTLQLPYRFFTSVMGKSYYAFDSSVVSSGPVGGGKKEYYEFGIGQIYSFQNTIYGIGETQIEKFLISKNSASLDYQSVIDSLKNIQPTGIINRMLKFSGTSCI